MANVSRNPREHWLKTHFLKNEVANSGWESPEQGIDPGWLEDQKRRIGAKV